MIRMVGQKQKAEAEDDIVCIRKMCEVQGARS